MRLSGKGLACAPVAWGLIAGASLGHAAGWLPLQVGLVALLVPLARTGVPAARAAAHVGAFALALACAALFGFGLGTPEALRPLAWVPLVGLFFVQGVSAAALAYAAFRVARRPATRVSIALPAAWLLHEWIFSLGDWAVPWVRLAHALDADAPLSGVLPWGGTLLAGAAMVSLGGVLALAAVQRATPRGRTALGAALAMVLVCWAAGLPQWTMPAGVMQVALVQPGVTSEQREHADEAAVAEVLAYYKRVAGETTSGLVVTPELALPKTAASLAPAYMAEFNAALETRGADALIGLHFEPEPGESGLYNGALALGASGVQRYLKSNLIPFGESNPLGTALRQQLLAWSGAGYGNTLRADAATEPLLVGGRRAALALCFEVAFAEKLRTRAANADLLVTMTSDSAVDSEQTLRQAMAIARLRAMELQKPMVRASDVRGTGVIDASGRTVAAAPHGIRAVVREQVELRSGLTPYGRFGDALALMLAITGLVLPGIAGLGRRGDAGATPRATLRLRPARRLAGQVLPAAVALLLVISGTFYLMVNSGQIVTEKIRVTNAADAAAYSAGIVEARALNFDAYMNRAIVANQIAIAQMLSLASWVDYFAYSADNFGDTAGDMNKFIVDPFRPENTIKLAILDVAFGVTAYYSEGQAHEWADYIRQGLGAVVTVHDVVAQALAASQKLVQANLVAGLRQRQIANDIVKAMDPDLSADLVLTSHGFDTFTKNYGKGATDERGRLADVTMRSRDAFTRDRSWTIASTDVIFVRKDGALKKRGATELVGYDEWRSVDTLELHGREFGCGKLGLSWCDDIRKPIGYGVAYASNDDSDHGRGYHSNSYGENFNSSIKGEWANESRPIYTAKFSGLPDTRDVENLDPKADLTTGVTIRVTKAQARTLTSGGAAKAKPSGSLALFNDKPSGGNLTALSRAQVFFDRVAARADGKAEIGSLYNPYWRVRLVAPTAGDRAYAAAFQGGMALPLP